MSQPVAPSSTSSVTGIDPQTLAQILDVCGMVAREVQKVFIGPAELPEILLTALLARGHALLEGVPGVAKTTLCKGFSRALGCTFKRIQFTPDLLPSDITGTYILDMRDNKFVLREGPIFAHIVLGDEINRAPAKTQSALLEAMQESQVTIEGETRPLGPPFMVLATQNPVEHEGTYPLPEAQVDRFLVKVAVRYPTPEDERRMLLTYNRPRAEIRAILSPEDIIRLGQLADQVHVEDELFDYILALTHYTRKHRRVYLGASPRAGLALLQASKARALTKGRDYVLPDDVKLLAPYVLSHRIMMTPEAELEGVLADAVVNEALERVSYKRVR